MFRRWALLIAIGSIASGIALRAPADSAWTQITVDGQVLDAMDMDSPPPWLSEPTPMLQPSGTIPPTTAVMISGVPTSSWNYGCSATAAGMIFGYYDRIGYDNMWAGGEVPLYMGDMNLGTACTLIATPQDIADYWVSYGSAGPDPWQTDGRSDHVWADCVADFMGTNQWKWDYNGDGLTDFNVDGGTALFSYNSAQKLYDYTPPADAGLPQTELCHGMVLFAESRGYTVTDAYTQNIDTLYAGGFSFADYMNEINNGDPVMIQLAGHSMVGVGYDAAADTVYVHDTWGDYTASMTWGGEYSGMQQEAVTVLHLAPLNDADPPDPAQTPELPTGILALLGLAPAMWVGVRRRWAGLSAERSERSVAR